MNKYQDNDEQQIITRFMYNRALNQSKMVENINEKLGFIGERFNSLVNEQISNNQEKNNRVMLILTITTVLILPMTVVTGMFGQNVQVPMQNWFVFNEEEFSLKSDVAALSAKNGTNTTLDEQESKYEVPIWVHQEVIPLIPFMITIVIALLCMTFMYCCLIRTQLQ